MENWFPYFKSNLRSAGERIFKEGKVSYTRNSDTQVQAFVKATNSIRVNLKTEAFGSPTIMVECTCPDYKKGQMCKHIWAVLLAVEKRDPDFLESVEDFKLKANPDPKTEKSPARNEARADLKLKQSLYRKNQYLKQKLRQKELKKNKQAPASAYPENVINALSYFSENGIPLAEVFSAEDIHASRKQLSRVFHPDVGGSHAEFLTLNRNSELLLSFLRKR